MSNVIRSLKTHGYNLEEAYFHKKERELIEKLRTEAGQAPTAEGAKVIEMFPRGKANESPPASESAPTMNERKKAA